MSGDPGQATAELHGWVILPECLEKPYVHVQGFIYRDSSGKYRDREVVRSGMLVGVDWESGTVVTVGYTFSLSPFSVRPGSGPERRRCPVRPALALLLGVLSAFEQLCTTMRADAT